MIKGRIFITLYATLSISLIGCTNVDIDKPDNPSPSKPWITTRINSSLYGILERQFVSGYGANESFCRSSDRNRFFNIKNNDLDFPKTANALVKVERTTREINRLDNKKIKTLTFNLAPGQLIALNIINSCAYTLPGAMGPTGIRSVHDYKILGAEYEELATSPTVQPAKPEPVKRCSEICSEASGNNRPCSEFNVSNLIPFSIYDDKKQLLRSLFEQQTSINSSRLHNVLNINSPKCAISTLEFDKNLYKIKGNSCQFKTKFTDSVWVTGGFPDNFNLINHSFGNDFTLEFTPAIPIRFEGNNFQLNNRLEEKFVNGITQLDFLQNNIFIGSRNLCTKLSIL